MNAPDIGSVLAAVADLIAIEFPMTGPAPDSYAAQQLMRVPMMMPAMRDEFDRAAHWRHEENQALRALFSQAATVVEDTALAARLVHASAQADDDLRVSSLEQSNRELRALLIDLQSWAESASLSAAADIERSIWSELRTGTTRRRSSLDRF